VWHLTDVWHVTPLHRVSAGDGVVSTAVSDAAIRRAISRYAVRSGLAARVEEHVVVEVGSGLAADRRDGPADEATEVVVAPDYYLIIFFLF
jgi:hypothetical protein